MIRETLVATGLLVAAACSSGEEPRAPDDDTPRTEAEGTSWLRGSTDERFRLVEKHLRGFDVAMVETGYRYGELYWAGQDRNWGYAAYQLEKIETAVANGVERRPRRAASARVLARPIEAMREAVETDDPEAFDRAFEVLTISCNSCHEAERVPFVTVAAPTVRASPVRNPLTTRPPPEQAE